MSRKLTRYARANRCALLNSITQHYSAFFCLEPDGDPSAEFGSVGPDDLREGSRVQLPAPRFSFSDTPLSTE
jgi:hypothetical protein